MGCSQLADALTGLAIPRGEPVVAIAVERRTGGYPDATTHAAMPPLSPSQAFEPVSLPIRARAGDYGDVEPDDGDLGARLLLELANKDDWPALAAEGFGYKASILLGAAAHGEEKDRLGFAVDGKPRVLGLVVFREETWNRVVGLGSQGMDREADVGTVLEAIGKARLAASAGDNTAYALNMDLARLAASNLYESDPDAPRGIRATRLPDLARALAGREGGDLMSGMGADGLRRSGVLGTRLLRQEPGPDTARVVGMVWDLKAAERGMDVLCRTWQPSYGAGQYDNAHEIAGSALDAFADASGSMLADIEEGMADEETAVPRLEALLARLDEVRAAVSARLDAAREHAFEP